MKKNTLLNKSFLTLVFLLVSLLGVARKNKRRTTFAFFFLGFFVNNVISAQVVITKPNLTIPVCSGYPTAYYPLGNIIIDENNDRDNEFRINASNQTIILTAPTNFEFNPGSGSIARSTGNDIIATGLAISVTSTTITITYNCPTANSDNDVLTISGIQIRAINSASTGNITRTGGTGDINGLSNGTTLTNTLASNTGCTYCAPTYSNGPGSTDQITNVTLGTLNNTSGASASPYYTFYNAVTIPNLTPSTTASISVSFGSDPNQYAAVWIDFNQNGTFETGEGEISGNAGSNGTVIINIPVPAGAILGNTRMRVRGGNDSALTTSQACGASSSNYGETEDYIVNIVNSTPPTITSLGATSGCAGSSITINGTNLSGATAANVKIGGTAVSSITSNSGTMLVAVIGAGTTGTVSVTTAGGTATSAATFTVNALPTADAGSALAAICQGTTTVALGGSFGGSATGATWSTTSGGTFANNSGSTPNTATWTPTVGFTGTATLVLTTAGGSCSTTTVSKTQVVNALPTANAGSALTAICQGTTTVALGGSFGGSATSATWSTNSGGTFANNSGSTPNTATWTPPVDFTGTATLVLTTTGGSCSTTTASKTQVVNAGPTANAGSALTAICQGTTTVALGGSFGGSATGATWSTTSGGTFTNNGGTTPNTTTWTPPVSFTGTATLILTTTGGSCSTTTASKTQVVNTTPTQPSTITGNATPCAGSSQVYSVTNVSGTTYFWTFPSGWTQTAGGSSNSVTVTVGATSGNITVIPSNTCGSGSAQLLATTLSTSIAQPSTITGNTALCAGTSQTYSVTNVSGITYNWSFPVGWSQTAGGTTNSVTVTVGASSGNISVTPSTSCGSGTARTLTTTVAPAPTITGTTPGSRTGAGTVNLSASASAGTISWYGSLTGGSALGTGPNFTTPGIISTTTYYVETNNGSCSSNPRVAVVATVNYPEITVLGNSNIIVDEDTTPITTDYTNLGTTGIGVGITRTYTIQNSGTVNLTIGTINITGLNASEFVVTTAPAASVAPAASTTFSIRFTPTVLGTRNANVSFVTNDPDENPFNFDIIGVGGTGLIPEINVRGNGTTIIDGDTGATTADHSDFGTVTIPGTVVRTFTIQNTGTGPLLLTGTPLVLITGSTDFTVTTQPSSNTIAAGSSLTFQVTYNPVLTGSSVAIISINNNDFDENVYDYTIIGTAVVSGLEIDIQGNEVSILDGDTTPSITDQTDFGITDAATPIALTYNVYSFGSAGLTLTPTISITGANASMFSATALPSSLGPAPAALVTSFVITFTPSASLGVKNATITITSNDPDEGTYNFDIRAEVQSLPALTVAPGGITSNLKFWLKADTNIGFVADNTAITTWQDQTYGNTKNAVSKFAKEPKFQNNPTYNVNFNPVIHFNGSNVMSGGQGFNNVDMFIVVKPTNEVNYTSSPMDVYCGDDLATNKNSQDVTGFEMGNTSARYTNDLIAYNQGANTSYGVAETSTTKFYSGANIFNPRKNATYPAIKMDILNNGNNLSTTEYLTNTLFAPYTYIPYKDIVNTRYWLGRSEFFDASYDGDILEIINYNTRNSDADKRKIETYLAIKYGITLGTNGTSLDYVNSGGATIYEAGTGFNYNIAGIGRDDKSQLNQKQSKTENTNSDITIGLGDIFDTNSNNTNAFDVDKKFLVWGHNNNTLAAQVPILVDMSTGITSGGSLTTMVDFISIARTWRVRETGGDVPLVKVSIPSSILTATINPPGDFLMFISDSPVFNPTAEYRIMRMNGSNLETEYDFSGTKYITFGYAPERTFVRCISFDGINDYLDAGKVLNLNTSFTVSSWIKRNGTSQTILSKRNNSFTTGYDLSINSDGKAEMSWINGAKQTITSSVVIPSGIWHNVAVSYDGTTAKLYIDGVLDVSKTMSIVPSNTQSFLIAAADGLNTTSFFNGGIDEVRVWNVALTDKQLRYVMNQEISRDATLTGGTMIPNSITLNDIKIIPWANLSAYYPMSTYTFTNAKDISNNNYTAALKNLTTVDRQTAPLPYESNANGTWQTPATWLNNTVQDLPNSLSIVDGVTPVDWNIVKTNHNITSTGNKTVLGLMVNSNTLTASYDTKIEVTNYLKLDGKIDLVGMSQLVQKLDCDLDVTSGGSIERDQQGQANKYNYNYWSSPVSPINTAANNTDFTLKGIMKDGFNATPREINWIAGYDGIAGNASTPLSIARYWLYTFDDKASDYANWNKITEITPIRVGLGYTMKGSGSSGTQPYTFAGKPNNGLINSNDVLSEQLLLTGNPYPSALDIDAFINDNAGSIDGTLYFWEHYASNNTHVLQDYQGGYAERNLTGGVPPVAPSLISGLGSSTKAPGQFVPVGQGFFVNGNSSSGGTIILNNNQRAFFIETDAANSNSMFKTRPKTSKTSNIDHWNDNSNTTINKENYKKVRLGFNSSNNYHRQILLGFMNEKATSGIDYGYDGINFDEVPNDMYFVNGEKQLVIQGEGFFNEDASYPIGVKTDVEGKVTFTIDALENFDSQQKVYIYDNETKTYNEIQNNAFEIIVPAGVNNTRFSLRFKDKSTDKTLSIDENNKTTDAIKIAHIQNSNILKISNNSTKNIVEKVTLFNINGQTIAKWNVENQDQQNIQLPIKNVSSGIYIAKLTTANGDLSKKLIIK